MEKEISVDLVIIGAGTAGISAFKEASKKTDNIILIDHGPLGTTCARVGCMPSKVLIQVADYYHDRLKFPQLGIKGSEYLKVDLKDVMQHVRKLRDYFTSSTIKYIEDLGPRFIKGIAKFIGPNSVEVNDKKIFAKSFIIATGTDSIMPAAWQPFKKNILTSENIFEQKDFPKKIAVIGGGPIGLELGQALSRLGIEIEIFHGSEMIGGLSDPIINSYAIKLLKNEFPLYLNAIASIEEQTKGLLVKTKDALFLADRVLAALGRAPNLSDLNLAAAGISVDQSGLPHFDKTTMQIDHHPIFIAGDAGKWKPFLHEAADEGRIAGFNAVREHKHCFARRTPLAIIFTEPNIAFVGKMFRDLQKTDFVTGEVSFEDQGRARIMAKNKGLLHIYAESHTGKLLGAEMIAPDGEHLAHLLAGAIQQKLTVFDMLQMPFYHPVVEEGMRTALRHAASLVDKKQVKSFELTMCNSEALAPLS